MLATTDAALLEPLVMCVRTLATLIETLGGSIEKLEKEIAAAMVLFGDPR